MKQSYILLIASSFLICGACTKINPQNESIEINQILDDWHRAAANGDFEIYFNSFADNAVFIGTDPTENWDIESFRDWSKPYFDRGKAWSFKAVERNVYFSESGKIAWFDELLDTRMKICRGSGVLERGDNGEWKIRHYVLSMTIPNENTSEVVEIKSEIEDEILGRMKSK